MEVFHGYTGQMASKLRSLGAAPGDTIEILLRDGTRISGVLMPRVQLSGSTNILVLKLTNGYNAGFKAEEIVEIRLISKRPPRPSVTSEALARDGELPKVSLLATGGTIASKVDYETGAVTPAMGIEEIIEWVPEISELANISFREVMRKFSEDFMPRDWGILASEAYKDVSSGVDGVVIAHGTDTMAYSASALAFAIRNKPVPIVFVGAQRSSDRPSSDSALNLISAFIVAAKAPFAESVITMHGNISDVFSLVHRGVKARKMHTSRRDAFQSVNDTPLAVVNPFTRDVKVIGKIVEERGRDKIPVLENKFDDKVALVKAYPGLQAEILNFLVDKGFHGIVLEGTGLGHIANDLINVIKRAVDSGIPVVMTSQCLFGRVNLHVYSTGRRLLDAGVIPASDMLPETAYVKLSWILGNRSHDLREIARIFTSNLVGEINERHTIPLYPRWYYG